MHYKNKICISFSLLYFLIYILLNFEYCHIFIVLTLIFTLVNKGFEANNESIFKFCNITVYLGPRAKVGADQKRLRHTAYPREESFSPSMGKTEG